MKALCIPIGGADEGAKVAESKGKGKEAQSKLSALSSDASSKASEMKKDTSRAIDDFDRKVEKKTSEAKSGLSSWFGGK